VLRNLLGITSVREMSRIESAALEVATNTAADAFEADHRFTAEDICTLHRLWLGEIYAWAGEYRSVNISRDGFMFAAAFLVPELMGDLEQGPLRRHTPCRVAGSEAQAAALATVHAELILTHPFREGNGRCARLLATLMGLQAGLPALNFDQVRGQERRRYVQAIQSAAGRDYEPLTAVFADVIRRTLMSFRRLPSA
jgi:cell filamentation protein